MDDLLSWDNLLRSSSRTSRACFTRAMPSTATVLYTSGPPALGSSVDPRLLQMRSLACVAFPEPGSPVLSVLPIWHAYERSASYYFLSCACSQHTTIKQLKDLPGVQPVAWRPCAGEAVRAGEDVLGPPARQPSRGGIGPTVPTPCCQACRPEPGAQASSFADRGSEHPRRPSFALAYMLKLVLIGQVRRQPGGGAVALSDRWYRRHRPSMPSSKRWGLNFFIGYG